MKQQMDFSVQKRRTGQSMVEYMLLFAIVVVVLMAALGPNGFMGKKLGNTLDESVELIDTVADSIDTAKYDN